MSRRLAFILSAFIFCFQEKPWWRAVRFISLHFQLWWKALPTLREDFCFPLWGKTFYFTLPTLMEGASYSEGGLLLPTLREDFLFYTSNSDGRRLLLWRRTFASHSEGRLLFYTSNSDGRLGELLCRPSQSLYQGWRCGARGSFIFVPLVSEFCLHNRRKKCGESHIYEKRKGRLVKNLQNKSQRLRKVRITSCFIFMFLMVGRLLPCIFNHGALFGEFFLFCLTSPLAGLSSFQTLFIWNITLFPNFQSK
jgi:hypothetical protein